VIFGRKKKDIDDDLDEEEEEYESILFQGALNGVDANLTANARLARAGLVPSKDLLTNAVNRRAETIIIEPKGQRSLVRFFIDGVSYPGGRFSQKQGLAVTQMIKLLAGLDIQQRRKPQSGGIHAELEKVPYQLLVESTPIAEGVERLTVEVRNLKQTKEKPDEIGFTSEMKLKIQHLGQRREGAILVCGAPRTGVTTTTYALLSTVDPYIYSVFSIADDPNREVMHMSRFDVNPEDSFQDTIIRLKRIECDVLIINPLRSAEATRNAFQAQKQMTIVAEFTAKDAAEGILQICRWLGNPQEAADGLSALISQKLVRLLCKNCRVAFRPNPKLLARVGLSPETKTLFRQLTPPAPSEEEDEEEFVPCDICGGIGFLGRTGLFELIEMNESMKQLISKGTTAAEIKAMAKEQNMQTLQKEGLRLVSQGKTSLEELQRVFRST